MPQQTNWDLRNLSLAHFAITDIDGKKFRYYEKLNRSSPFTAMAAAGRLEVFNEAWRAATTSDGAWRVDGAQNGDAIDLVLRSRKPPAIHGENGVSVKAQGPGYASHYYSMTRLEVTGSVTVRGRKPERATGLAWMDHEFGSAALRENQQGWDWFSVQLDNDAELMLYQIRRSDGTPDATSSGSCDHARWRRHSSQPESDRRPAAAPLEVAAQRRDVPDGLERLGPFTATHACGSIRCWRTRSS